MPFYRMTSTTNIWLKAKYSFISALVFFLVANPETYKFTQNLFGALFNVIDGGAVTPTGLLLHTFIFFAAILGLMISPNI